MSVRIAFCGQLRSGKDSAAAFLRDTHGFTCVSIAETMKATVYAACNAAGVDTSTKGSMRTALQDGGVAARAVDPEVWIGSLVRRYHLEEDRGESIACSDLRFLNEAAALRRCGFMIVRIEASRQTCEARALAVDGSFDLSAFNHPCEAEIDLIDADLVIRNDDEEDRPRMFKTLSALVAPSLAVHA